MAATVAALLVAAPAAAQTAEYSVQLDKFCCYMTLETGDTAEQFISFKNTGTKTWFPTGEVPVLLGASNPFDRTSPFFNQADWVAPHRPTALDQAQVPSGQIGRFTWITKAPTKPGAYREYYAPVAELKTWMAAPDVYYLDYTVIAAQAPVVKITGAAARVKRGDPIAVTADATDNRGVSRVTFTVDAETKSADPTPGTSAYGALLSSAGLGAGTHNIVVRAYDLGGRESSAVSALEVYEGPGGSAPGVRTRLPAFKPLFATRASRGRGLGTFNGLGDVVGAQRGALLRVLCVSGCARKLKVVRRVPARGSLKITLPRPLPLRSSTRVELQLTAPGFVTRYQRYRFRRRPEGTRGLQVSAGCLARKKPRRTTRCPST
jgi:hypothetical protein